MDKILIEDKHLTIAAETVSAEIRICNRPFQQGLPPPPSPPQDVPTDEGVRVEQGDSQFELEIEDNLRAGSQQVLSDACVRIYTSSLCALRDVVEHPPQFFTGKTIMWCHRPSQSEIDAVWIEKNPDGEEVLVNLRRNSRSAVWESMEYCPFGSLEFEDGDDLLQHANSWPIPKGYFRDYKLKFGAFTGLIRIYG